MSILRPGGGLEPKDFGLSVGAPRVPEEHPTLQIPLAVSGLNVSAGSEEIEQGESPSLVDVRLTRGGVGADYDTKQLGAPHFPITGSKVPLGFVSYQDQNRRRVLVMIRATKLDWWDGAAWRELGGTMSGLEKQRVMATSLQGKLIIANGIDRLQAWDGLPSSSVFDLSAEAPRAMYVTRIGQRLIAAGIRMGPGDNPDPELLLCSADGDITKWTDGELGARQYILEPVGPTASEQAITGLSTLSRSLIVYRQRSIMVGTMTGVSLLPFRFTPVEFNLGTESPYAIGHGGLGLGDFFLGQDGMPYIFDGNEARPIGLPIVDLLQDEITSLKDIVGFVDTKGYEYWLCLPTAALNRLGAAYIFNIREYVKSGKLVWRKRMLDNYTAAGADRLIPLTADPVINSVPNIINTVPTAINSMGMVETDDLVLFGGADSTVYRLDTDKGLSTGIWHSKQFGHPDRDLTIDWIRLHYTTRYGAVVLVAVSTDGGITYSPDIVYELKPTALAQNSIQMYHMVTGGRFIIRLKFTSGLALVSRIGVDFALRGAMQG